MLLIDSRQDADVQTRLHWLNCLDAVPSEYRVLLCRPLYTLKQYWRERRLGLSASASAAELRLIATAWIDATERNSSIQELATLGGFAVDIIEWEHCAPAAPT